MLTKPRAAHNGEAKRQTSSESGPKASRNVEMKVGAIIDMENDSESSLYRLHSILLHTGTANGGHYKAYVLDSIAGRWLECNDSSVCELSEREEASLLDKPLISEFNFCDTEGSDKNDDGKDKSSIRPSPSGENTKKYVTFKDDVLRKNAYMLLYKRVPLIAEGVNLHTGSFLEIYSSEEKVAANRLLESCTAAVPTGLSEKILAENNTLQELRKLHQIHMKIVPLKVVYDRATLHGLEEGPCETSTSENSNGCTNGSVKSDMRAVDLLALNTDSLKNVQSRVCSMLDLSTAPSSGHSYRLREFSEISGRKGTTHGARGDESLASLGLHHPYSFPSPPPVVLLLESRSNSDPPFTEMNDKAMLLRVLVWSEKLQAAVETAEGLSETLGGLFPVGSDGENGEANDPNVAAVQASMMELLVPGEHLATLGALREAIALELNYAVTQITLVMCNDKEALVMELDQDHRSLKKAYGICPGDLVFVEIREATSPSVAVDSEVHDTPPALTTDSVALNALKRYLCMVTIRFNDPRFPAMSSISQSVDDPAVFSLDNPSVATHDLCLKVPSRMILEDVKKMISDKLGMGSIDDFHLVKSDCPSAQQYKDGTLTLYDLGIGDQGILHIRVREILSPKTLHFLSALSE
jgi:Ubiquitin carboxyl-terminal hydrolase